MSQRLYIYFLKPAFDFFIASIALIIVSPLMLLLMLLLAVHFRGNPFFTQIRPGKGERTFKLFKFKSMKDTKDLNGKLIEDHMRLTRLGKLLRVTSLDELPQLINVLKGDMSLVGPRPLLMEYIPLYNDVQKRRHDVRPGITGWAQVNGRNGISWEEKFRFDVWYIDNISFRQDVKILWMTFIKVIHQEKINAGQHITMEKLKGNG